MRIIQQKLGKRNTYIPTNTSLVCSSMAVSLNKEETLSEHSLKTFSNIPEENQQSGKTGQDLRVPVLNMQGNPLMPTSSSKARHLLKRGKAKVIKRTPFVIQMLIATGETKQGINLGIDSGSSVIGFSATTKTKELISGELNLRNDMSEKLQERKMYRRGRRSKLWYRQPRFLNRVKTKKKGWLAPSIQHKIDTHIRLVEKIKTLLPITQTIVEVAQFDTQKLQNCDIHGIEYQQGQMEGYDNLRAFILSRDKYICQICKKREGIFDIHHIIHRKEGGSNRSDNLICVHTKCHKNFHSGKIRCNFIKPMQFKETAVMNNIKSKIIDLLGCDYTYGYITKRKRVNLGINKTHCNDAFVISGGDVQSRCKYNISKQTRRNNRQLQQNRKGQKLAVRRQRYKIQSGDIISFKNNKLICNGMFNLGKYVSFAKSKYNIKYAKINEVGIIKYGKGIQI